MKHILLLLMLLFSGVVMAQKKFPVISANTKNAFTAEGNEEKERWTLSPVARPDVYTLAKSPGIKLFAFYTDVDSIKIKLRPGEKFVFVALLNGKDSCYTCIESPALKDFSKVQPEMHDSIPFVLTKYNNVVAKVVLDHKDTLNLKFDSGSTDFRITNETIKKLGLKELSDHTFQLGNQIWEKQTVYPVELSGQGTEGRFGWNLFDGKIVEIDYDRSLFIVHSRLPGIRKGYEKFEMEYSHGLFCIRGELQLKNKKYRNRFLFDNGYQRTVMLDEDLMKEQQYPKDSLEIIKKVIMHNGEGKAIPVLTVNNEKLNLGKYTLKNVPVQLLSTGNPAGFKTHILGNEVLKRFNTILDFQKNVVYLKPNGLYGVVYSEEKK